MKIKTQYSCQNCGHASSKWLGRCPTCGEWNKFVEERTDDASQSGGSLASVREEFRTAKASAWVDLDMEDDEAAASFKGRRITTGMAELDRVLGGGMVPDSFTLIGGDPGIGKSTLLLQTAKGILGARNDLKLLYVSGEESVGQIRSRAKRLGISGEGRVFLAAETQLERVFSAVKELRPSVLVMDSLQTFSSGYLESAPGSVGQVREVAARLMMLAKTAGLAVWLVGHVTKDGSIAGPRTVEHMVDTVLYFEGDDAQSYRLLRTVKNRFGSTRELGVFEMRGEGLREVPNPSSLFLSERGKSVPGTAVTASLEGSRPLLAEVQALVSQSPLSMPRRTAVGMDSNRIALLVAILDKHAGVSFEKTDVYFNVAGGLRLSEPACDLAAAAAIWSSAADRAFPPGVVFVGEVGLTGEIRRVSQLEARVQEARRLGFETVVMPPLGRGAECDLGGIEALQLASVAALGDLFG